MRVEIAHDILARAVYDKSSEDEKMRLRVQRMVRERYAFAQEQGDVWLQEIDLEVVDSVMDQLTLSPAEKQFVQESSQRLHKEQMRRKRKNFLFIMVPLAAIVVLGSVFLYSYKKAKVEELQMAEQEKKSTSKLTQEQNQRLYSLIEDRFRMFDKAKEQAVFINQNKSYLVGMGRRSEEGLDSLVPKAAVEMPNLLAGLPFESRTGTGDTKGPMALEPEAGMLLDKELLNLLSDSIEASPDRVEDFLKAQLEQLKRENK